MNYLEINKLIDSVWFNRYFPLFSRLIRFGIVGFSGVFVDLGIFYCLHILLNLDLTFSAMLSTEVAIINNFLWNDLWTFGDISDKQQLASQRLQRFLRFNLICFVGLIFNVLIVNFLVYQFAINEFIAKLGAIIFVTLWNFGINFGLNWKPIDTSENIKL
jgi:dolichol-phosphate mannosyltransferase